MSFHSLKTVPKDFNLLYLDYSEILLQSCRCYFFNLNGIGTNPLSKFYTRNASLITDTKVSEDFKKQVISGIIHFTSANMIFQPDNINLPLVKFKYFDNTSFREINILDICELEPQQTINLKSNNYLNSVNNNFNLTQLQMSNQSREKKEDDKKYNKKNFFPGHTMTRYEEKAPFHISLLNFSDELTKFIDLGKVKIAKEVSKKNINSLILENNNNNNNYNKSHEYLQIVKYFTDFEVDNTHLFDALSSYLLSTGHKEREYNTFNFLNIHCEQFKTISRTFYKSYFEEDIP